VNSEANELIRGNPRPNENLKKLEAGSRKQKMISAQSEERCIPELSCIILIIPQSVFRYPG